MSDSFVSDSFVATVINAQQGDSDAREWVVQEFSGLIQHECSKYGLRQHPDWSQSDLYQEAVIHVLSGIEQFRGVDQAEPRAALEQWIRVATRNWMSNLARSRTAKKRFPKNGFETVDYGNAQGQKDLQGQTKTASSIFVHEEEFDRLELAMRDHLSEEQREVLLLRVVEGFTLKEISEHLQLSYEQVRYRYEKSLEKIQRHL